MKIGNFKSTKKFLLQVFRANEVAQFPSEDPNFHLVYNSSNLGFFVCPHGSSLCALECCKLERTKIPNSLLGLWSV